EWPDNQGRTDNLLLTPQSVFSADFKAGLLQGVETLASSLPVIQIRDDGQQVNTGIQAFLAIPYYAWANRGQGEMNIWLPSVIRSVDLISK
ncbi:MAG TPA: hypothetical protein VMI35_07755, partial [Puia sp.]|nr:hypothetical protein [Puia sp.]